MKAKAIKRSLCVCTECEPLPPIEGLHSLAHEEDTDAEVGRPRGFLGFIAERVIALRRQD
ncbi:hypothetical protein [Rhizobium leguminosarum]|uniref:hypothetical protein n=1 Tax=Rhizobium leguminosarum TaxID=384 RepID=UPI001D1BD37B|nr:hypothetical protein [Rhizobium leguminosarum]MBY5563832.1 hypothetical protein [Rhizobium leguminosarum]MBY5709970.1 hypothetical protein [Rhizobium leguminosarum]